MPQSITNEGSTPATTTGSSPAASIQLANPPNGLTLSNGQLGLTVASASSTGALSSTDYNTFKSTAGNPSSVPSVGNTLLLRDGAGTGYLTALKVIPNTAATSAVQVLSGGTGDHMSIGIGRTGTELELCVAGANGEFNSTAVPGDCVIRTTNDSGNIIFGAENSTTPYLTMTSSGCWTPAFHATSITSSTINSTTNLVMADMVRAQSVVGTYGTTESIPSGATWNTISELSTTISAPTSRTYLLICSLNVTLPVSYSGTIAVQAALYESPTTFSVSSSPYCNASSSYTTTVTVGGAAVAAALPASGNIFINVKHNGGAAITYTGGYVVAVPYN